MNDELLRRVMAAAASRLHATRLRMLDLYTASASGEDPI